jgi:hypothetical protein
MYTTRRRVERTNITQREHLVAGTLIDGAGIKKYIDTVSTQDLGA